MPTLPHPSTLSHARRVVDLLALFADLCEANLLHMAGAALLLAWRAHEQWPLDVEGSYAADLRGRALCALADGERALARSRAVDYYADAGRIVDVEGWSVPTRSAA